MYTLTVLCGAQVQKPKAGACTPTLQDATAGVCPATGISATRKSAKKIRVKVSLFMDILFPRHSPQPHRRMGDKTSPATLRSLPGCAEKISAQVRDLFLYAFVRDDVIVDSSLQAIHLTHYLEITGGRCNQSVITVDSRKTIHDSLLLLTGAAVPQPHAMPQLVRHKSLQRMWACGGKVEINPGRDQKSIVGLSKRVKEGVMLPIILMNLASCHRQTTLAINQTFGFSGIYKSDSGAAL